MNEVAGKALSLTFANWLEDSLSLSNDHTAMRVPGLLDCRHKEVHGVRRDVVLLA